MVPEGESEASMTNDDLRRDVVAELYWDPRVGGSAIEVSAASGMVTLRGTVASLRHKRAGGNAAARVRGVTRVANELRVQLPDRDQRDDEDLCGDVTPQVIVCHACLAFPLPAPSSPRAAGHRIHGSP